MLPQRDGVIGERNDGERGDHERQAEPEQAVAKKGAGVLCARPGHTNNPDRKKNIAMKKLSVASTITSKPIHDLASV